MACVFSPEAEADLQGIGDYIAADSPGRALSFVRELRERCRAIAAHPRAAPLRPEYGEGYRVAPHRQYLIIYREVGPGVRVVRVLHGMRDVRRLLREP